MDSTKGRWIAEGSLNVRKDRENERKSEETTRRVPLYSSHEYELLASFLVSSLISHFSIVKGGGHDRSSGHMQCYRRITKKSPLTLHAQPYACTLVRSYKGYDALKERCYNNTRIGIAHMAKSMVWYYCTATELWPSSKKCKEGKHITYLAFHSWVVQQKKQTVWLESVSVHLYPCTAVPLPSVKQRNNRSPA